MSTVCVAFLFLVLITLFSVLFFFFLSKNFLHSHQLFRISSSLFLLICFLHSVFPIFSIQNFLTFPLSVLHFLFLFLFLSFLYCFLFVLSIKIFLRFSFCSAFFICSSFVSSFSLFISFRVASYSVYFLFVCPVYPVDVLLFAVNMYPCFPRLCGGRGYAVDL